MRRMRASTEARSSAVARSILLSSTISAKPSCSCASGARSISPRRCLASTTVTMASSLVWRRTSSSTKKVWRDGGGIGKSGGFDDDTIHATLAPHQAAKNSYEIAAHRTADAAVVHFEDLFFGVDDQVIVDSDLAEFIDNDGIAFAVRLREDSVEQRGLSGTEIAGDHGDGSLVRRRLHGIVLWLCWCWPATSTCGRSTWSFPFRQRVGQAALCGQRRKRIGKIRPGD